MDLVYGFCARVTTLLTLAREDKGQTFTEYAISDGERDSRDRPVRGAALVRY